MHQNNGYEIMIPRLLFSHLLNTYTYFRDTMSIVCHSNKDKKDVSLTFYDLVDIWDFYFSFEVVFEAANMNAETIAIASLVLY